MNMNKQIDQVTISMDGKELRALKAISAYWLESQKVTSDKLPFEYRDIETHENATKLAQEILS